MIPLFDSNTTTFTSTPPFKPKAGEVYVMKLDIGHESMYPMNTFVHPLENFLRIKSGMILEEKQRYITDRGFLCCLL